MDKIGLPAGALLFVGDGRKARFLRNAGNWANPKLVSEHVFADENPRTRDQGSDRPGRVFQSAGTTLRSSVETPDWHEIEEHRFARKVAAVLEEFVRKRDVRALVIAAPPRTLAELRRALHADVKDRVVAEIDKDLTNLPIGEIEKRFTGPGPAGIA